MVNYYSTASSARTLQWHALTHDGTHNLISKLSQEGVHLSAIICKHTKVIIQYLQPCKLLLMYLYIYRFHIWGTKLHTQATDQQPR